MRESTPRGAIESLLLLVASAVVIATGLSLLATRWWFAELFSHFPLQYLAAAAVTVPALLVCRRRLAAAILALAAIPSLLSIGPWLPGLVSTAVADVPADAVRLVAANILYRSEDAPAVLRYVRSARPDLLVLTEFTPRWRKSLRDLDQLLPHAVIVPRTSAWGMALYSRYPLKEVENVNLGDSRAVNLRVVVDLPGGPIEFWGLHLASPGSGDLAQLRDTQLDRLAERLRVPREEALPRVLAGDLNITPFSPVFQRFLADAGLKDARAPFGLQVTWPAWPVPVWIPIDHVLVDGGIQVHRMATGPSIGSDHFPVEASFSVPRS